MQSWRIASFRIGPPLTALTVAFVVNGAAVPVPHLPYRRPALQG
jgi:hypothetical protein